MTGTEYVTAALQALNVLQASESLAADDALVALTCADRMLDAWAAERLMLSGETRTTKALTSGTASYTIGSGGAINLAWPTYIARAGFVLDSTATTPIEWPIAILDVNAWAGIPQKTLAEIPASIFFDRQMSGTTGLGTIYTYPVSNVANGQLVLYTPTVLSSFGDGTTDYTFPPGYKSAIHYNLCVELASTFGGHLTPEMGASARQGKARLKTANLVGAERSIDRALLGGWRYDITTHQFL